MSRLFCLILLLAAGLGLVLRWPSLNQRPMHNDEAVNAVKFGRLWEESVYKYDPDEHHGPTLYYAALALGRITAGPDIAHYSENRLRWVTVLFGLGLVLLLPLMMDALSRGGTAWAALFTAVSPALVFYSGYFIHESLLVFFNFLALAAGWRYWLSRKIGWILLAGVALGLMAATKETFVLTLGAAAIAVGINQTWNRWLDASGLPVSAPRLNFWHLAAGLAAAVAVALILFSSFFTNASGPVDSIRTYMPWIQRAGGETPHIHPWYFYLHRLLWFHAGKGPVWTEGLIFVLAVLGAVAGFRRRKLDGANASFVRFLALYAFLLIAFYSLLAYKTPWCLLSFWQAAVLLAGIGAAVLVRSLPSRAGKLGVIGLLLAGSAHLAWQSWMADTTYSADQRNPYVYAQTSSGCLELVERVKSLDAASPEASQMLIKVIAADGDYWPLPWYLRQFPRVGWWDQVPADPFAPVMIVSANLHAALDEKKTHLMTGLFQLRPRVFLELYVEKALWQRWLASHPPEKE
jgi:uncharacterized protein (TIGR03663 family)